ncbi:hypothetical protein V6N11_036972 [Hibiscus sabdariffa]|uniref:Uncharacterized protein n=1 Tax=Hibiscus sabdariffa TaxID=183260 RepID=A0ABR2RCI5_9ROSI
MQMDIVVRNGRVCLSCSRFQAQSRSYGSGQFMGGEEAENEAKAQFMKNANVQARRQRQRDRKEAGFELNLDVQREFETMIGCSPSW